MKNIKVHTESADRAMKTLQETCNVLDDAYKQFRDDASIEMSDSNLNDLIKWKLDTKEFLRATDRYDNLPKNMRAKAKQELDFYLNAFKNKFDILLQELGKDILYDFYRPSTQKRFFIIAQNGKFKVKPSAKKDLGIAFDYEITGENIELYDKAKKAIKALQEVKELLEFDGYNAFLEFYPSEIILNERKFLILEREGMSKDYEAG